jgi:hypothetical protein
MYVDSWINLNGSQRTTRLKKPREVEEIEFFLPASEYIRRVIRGVYDKPKYSTLLQEYSAPNPNEIADALARNYSWTIAPTGNTALNLLGLSTQVPANWSYISSGP